MKKSCKKIDRLILESLSSTLPAEEAAELDEHINRCSRCKAYLRAVQADDKMLAEFAQAMQPRITALESKVLERSQCARYGEPPGRSRFANIIKNRMMPRLAVAAALVIAVLVTLHYFGSSVSRAGLSWAVVAQRVQNAPSFSFRHLETTTGPRGTIEVQSVVYNSLEHGIRQDMYLDQELVAVAYVWPTESVITRIWTQKKKYSHTRLTDKQVEEIRRQLDPRRIVHEFMSFEYEDLGTDVVDGVNVQGMQVNDPRFRKGTFERATGRLWADLEADLPVRLEVDGLASGGEIRKKIVAYAFDWDVELQRSLFQPRIPNDYALMAEVDISDVSFDQKSLIQGLLIFAELTEARYPSSLAMATAIRETEEAVRKKFPTAPDESPSYREIEAVANMQAACTFYAKLIEENRDLAYHGDTVTPEFPTAVLMRWKIAPDQYQVIFGDLSVATINAERLAQLESRALNTKSIAVKPRPTDAATAPTVTEMELSWMPGADAAAHQLYFGTQPDTLTLLAEVADPVYNELPELETDTTYYWRVDEVQTNGSVLTGDVWSFTTGKLIAWWKFDDGLGRTADDASAGGNPGTLNNMQQTSWVQGLAGRALEFDGVDDCVETTLKIDQTGATSITMMAWVYPTSTSPGRHHVISTDDGWWDWSILRQDDRWHAFTGNGSWDCEFAVDINRWQHVAVVFMMDEDVIFYKNAVAKSRGFGPVTDSSYNPITIGNNPGPWNEYFEGIIDDVRIYSFALAPQEIAAIYQETAAALP
ncbi:MAG: LamG-like jellyroll fold domain-containing protein [Planctomycetota bacterium]